jgi:hypothetical protein
MKKIKEVIKMLNWSKDESKSTRWMEVVTCDSIKIDAGEKGSFVRYPGKEDVYFTFATSIGGYYSLENLEDWYIDGNDVYVKFDGEPSARQHIGKIVD